FDSGFKTHLSRFHHTYWDAGDIKSLESSLVIVRNNKSTKHNVSINSPFNIDGVKVYQSSDYGYALQFLLKKANSKEVMTHFLLDRPDSLGKPAIGGSAFPTTEYIFDMKFYPDITKPSFYPSKPILYLSVAKKGTVVFKGLLIPGQTVRIKEDILQFVAIKDWSGLIFATDIGKNLTYPGFIITITGMVIIYFFPYKTIRLTRHGDSIISINGITKRYHAIFEEEVNNIRTELGVKMDG
ncbi:MAG: cytochrome c biogenesis protein ResB, partial [Nitrospirae bacterium]|nr:cytochrome c biogenesis protein ResB [Nitrospirota bacterium]